jgi:sialate O-acetylesterase
MILLFLAGESVTSRSKIVANVISCVLLAVVSVAHGEVKVPSIIGSNMVLQQNHSVKLWGWANAGEKISVETCWTEKPVTTTTGNNGEWLVTVDTPKAGGPYTVSIKGTNTITLENVMIGEVWVCSGQSNMQLAVNASNNHKEEIKAANYPNIRLFHLQRKAAVDVQQDCTGSWTECSPQTVPGFSAVAYYFGRELHRKLEIPIGLIHTSWGGTPAESWTRREYLLADDDFKTIIEQSDKTLADNPKVMEGPGRAKIASSLYNAMIAPIIPYTIQGVIWYQGEANAARSYQYRTLFPTMIKNWRDDWGLGDFPFYFVQIAPYKDQTPEIRMAQLIAYRNTPNTGIVVITDIGNVNDIHPKNKQDVGKRLAGWALHKTYGWEDVTYSGPLYRAMRIEGNKIRILFDNTGSGLVAKGGDLTYFTIAEEGKDFVPARAVIDGDTVVVSSDQVKNPAAVRFAWENSAEPNLFNKEGLPASPFKTDDRQWQIFSSK